MRIPDQDNFKNWIRIRAVFSTSILAFSMFCTGTDAVFMALLLIARKKGQEIKNFMGSST
jgi:hypothetical protein